MSLQFNSHGLLDSKDFELTFEEIRRSVLVLGPPFFTGAWDRKWRGELVTRLEVVVSHLVSVGITDVFIDGSFVEDKEHPNDIDGYFVTTDARDFLVKKRALAQIDPVWTWDPAKRKRHPESSKVGGELPMWIKYRIELFPHYPGIGGGVTDKHGNQREFPAAFRIARDSDRPKGIVKIGGLK